MSRSSLSKRSFSDAVRFGEVTVCNPVDSHEILDRQKIQKMVCYLYKHKRTMEFANG